MDRITETERDARVDAFKEVLVALEASDVSSLDIGMATAMNIKTTMPKVAITGMVTRMNTRMAMNMVTITVKKNLLLISMREKMSTAMAVMPRKAKSVITLLRT